MYEPARYPSNAVSRAPAEAGHAAFFRKVYALMALGLGATAVTALLVASSEEAIRFIVLNRPVFYGLLIAELAMVWGFSALVNRISTVAAGAMFFTYAIMNGLTL
ncbi:MAG: Bax inhibitor-1 family protein, partial [Byssovorax sp.]